RGQPRRPRPCLADARRARPGPGRRRGAGRAGRASRPGATGRAGRRPGGGRLWGRRHPRPPPRPRPAATGLRGGGRDSGEWVTQWEGAPEVRAQFERLAGVAAALLSERRYTPFLHRLLAVERGTWRKVRDLCEGMETLPRDAHQAFQACGDTFVVTHLAWPGLPPDDPGCMVLFFHEDEYWSYAAYLNTAAVRGEDPR